MANLDLNTIFSKMNLKTPTALGKAEIEKILGNEIISDPIVQSRIEILCENDKNSLCGSNEG